MSQPAIIVAPSTDARKLSAVARACFLETFADLIEFDDIARRARDEDSPDGIAADMAEGARLWLASVKSTGSPVGYSMLCPPDLPDVETGENDAELKRIYLLHRFQGGGTGQRLLQAVIAQAREQGAPRLLLGVHAGNPAVLWYQRQGFAKIGERRFRVGDSYFSDDIMALELG